MTDPYEGYSCQKLKHGQSCDDCLEYDKCQGEGDDTLVV